MRLRQAVLVAAELEPAQAALRDALGLGEPFHDPGVGEFGLRNAVFALGDCFLEVVSPIQPGTAAGRYLARRGGDAGYMAIFDLEDLAGARARAQRSGVRVVWQIDLPDISGTHLHPADMGGTIVSLDQSRPYGTWRWGGPLWTGRTDIGAPGRLSGITLAVADPPAVAARWGEVLGVTVSDDEQPLLRLDGAQVRFQQAPGAHGEGLAEITIGLPPDALMGRSVLDLDGVRLQLRELS